MGIGRYQGGKFDLIVSLRHNADATRITQWERSFRRASEILYDATDGQMQFDRIFVANDSRGTAEADAFLLPEEGTSSSSVNALGSPGFHMNLKADEKNKPFIVIHEFGHYGLGVYDEYTGSGGNAECTGDASSGACIMEFAWTQGDQISDAGVLTPGIVNEFCVADNHDPDGDSNQDQINGEPCWQTMQDLYPGLVVPSGLPNAPMPAGHTPIDWILLADEPRFSLVLDRSGSMSANDAIAGVRYGADYWVNYLAQFDELLSVTSYNHGHDTVLPLELLTPTTNLAPITAAIGALTATGATNIGGAMAEGRTQIMSPGGQAATQVMIVFSDGRHNSGVAPESVIPSLVAAGIRAYTIGFGPNADQVRLQDIATSTGGSFFQIDPLGSSVAAQLDIQNSLIEISGEVRDGSGVVTTAPGLLPEPPAGEPPVVRERIVSEATTGALTHVSQRPFDFSATWDGFDHRAFIEDGSERATFVVSHAQGTRVGFYLTTPSGKIVDPATDGVTLVRPRSAPYSFYVVERPEPGWWVMRVTRGRADGPIPFKVFAFSEHRALHVAVDGAAAVHDVAVPVRIRAQAIYDVPLTGLRDPVLRIVALNGETGSSLPKPVILRERQSSDRRRSDGNGVYEGSVTFTQPGIYTAEVVMINRGEAREATGDAERVVDGDRHDEVKPPPLFYRTKRFQIHVGPLSPGRDVEQPNGDCCEEIKRCLERMVEQLGC